MPNVRRPDPWMFLAVALGLFSLACVVSVLVEVVRDVARSTGYG